VFRWILDTGTPRYEHGVFVGFVGSCLDITELRDAQDLRLRELHHRVKNNLQLISSLLNLTKASLDAKGRAVLDETQARIRSIALVVEITAIQLPPNGFRITVADDGVGLPPGFEVTTSESLGFQLVTTLVDQLGGSFEIRRGLGTAFDLVVSSR